MKKTTGFAIAMFMAPLTVIATNVQAAVNYSLKAVTFYQYGAPGDVVAGSVCTDTGWVRFINTGTSTLTGNFSISGVDAQGIGHTESVYRTVGPGETLGSMSNNTCDSSNVNGYNKRPGDTDLGIEIRFDGTATQNGSSESIALTVFDKDVHSGVVRYPFGTASDSYVFQGGDPYGRDTGDDFEVTQAPGSHTWSGVIAPPTVSMVGMADSSTTACAAIGDLLTFDVIVTNPPITLVAGQFAIRYDTTVLQFVSIEGGENPITSIPLTWPNAAEGKLFWVSSVESGGTGTAATTRVARLKFRAIADDCDGNTQVAFDPAFAPILTADGNGTPASLPTVNPLPITIDSVGPVISNVPADLVVAADAGAGCLAVREIGNPTVTDSCSAAVLTWSRSDGAALLSAPWLCGTTVVTWTATDACGRTSTATTSVTVNSYHLMNVTVAYAGTDYASSMTRCIGFRVDDVTLTDVMTFMSGTATATLQLPIGNYNCATADDDLHSLVSQVPVSINGTNYQMNVTGDSALINGDLDDDNVVNVVDWGVLVVRVGMAAAVNTDCTTVGFHADFDGDGTVTNADGNRLLQSFLVQGDTGCNAFNANGGPVVTRISVADLSVIAGMNASAADMNRDGVVDAKDIAMWTRLQSMPGRQPLTAKGVSSRN